MEAQTPARSTQQFPLAAIPGDYARGLRTLSVGVAPRGDFATGIRRSAMTQTTGDYATGVRVNPDGATALGDFATGMRAPHTARPTARGTSTRSGLRHLQESTEPAI